MYALRIYRLRPPLQGCILRMPNKEQTMTLQLKKGSIRLGPNQTLKVVDGAGSTVSAIEGSVWITEENQPNDIVIAPGDSYRLRQRGVALGIARTNDIVIVQITLSAGRTLGQKRRLFRRIADNLAALGLRREDAWINLVEVPKENWSFGLGEASYAAPERALA